MPPALSDNESSNSSVEGEVVPIRNRKSQSNTPAKHVPGVPEEEDKEDLQRQKEEEQPNDDDDDEDDEGGGEEEDGDDEVYVVEKILKHRMVKGVKIYHVRWEGYPAMKDHTWETEDNLASAQEVVDAYEAACEAKKQKKKASQSRKSSGGDDEASDEEEGKKKNGNNATGTKRKGRKSIGDRDGISAAKRAKQDWEPPAGSWEHDVDYVETVEESLDPKTGNPDRYGYVIWNNGKKTQHPLHHLYQKCPQKMLKYYEQHLVFHQTGNAEDSLNGA